jgi:polyphosphate kinase 2
MNDFPAYTLIDTETRRIVSHFVEQEFQISVARPVLHPGDRPTSYPVLYLFDANFYFGGVTEMTRLMRECNEFPVTMIVGIGYPFAGPVNEMIDMVSGWRTRDFTPVVSPRVFRVVALPAPSEREKSQMYFQRYMPHLPAAGEVVIFDRSWYNRAGVERVMGFATEEQVNYFLKYAPAVERAISYSGIILIKYWLEVSMEVQDERLRARDEDSRKIWKLTPMDLKSYSHWYDYSRARDAMFAATDTPETPWFVVDANDKRRARLNCITHLLGQVPYEEVPRESVKFPERQARGDYVEPDYDSRMVPAVY